MKKDFTVVLIKYIEGKKEIVSNSMIPKTQEVSIYLTILYLSNKHSHNCTLALGRKSLNKSNKVSSSLPCLCNPGFVKELSMFLMVCLFCTFKSTSSDKNFKPTVVNLYWGESQILK